MGEVLALAAADRISIIGLDISELPEGQPADAVAPEDDGGVVGDECSLVLEAPLRPRCGRAGVGPLVQPAAARFAYGERLIRPVLFDPGDLLGPVAERSASVARVVIPTAEARGAVMREGAREGGGATRLAGCNPTHPGYELNEMTSSCWIQASLDP